jgi:hypothetical protein
VMRVPPWPAVVALRLRGRKHPIPRGNGPVLKRRVAKRRSSSRAGFRGRPL